MTSAIDGRVLAAVLRPGLLSHWLQLGETPLVDSAGGRYVVGDLPAGELTVGDGPPGGNEAQAPRYFDPHAEQTEPCAGRTTTRCMQFYYARLAESRNTHYIGGAKATAVLMTPEEAAAAAPLLQPLPDTPAAETLP